MVYIGNFLVVTLLSDDDLEVDEVLASKSDSDSILRELNFLKNKRKGPFTILHWYRNQYLPFSHRS
jgi:hypothetical protein